MLFLTSWCRKRPSQSPSLDTSTLPLQISSSSTLPPASAHGPNSLSHNRSYRHPRSNHNRSNARPGHRKSKPNLKGISSTIPIRGYETPKPARLATSAPTTYSPLHGTTSPAAALARMTAGGYKPRQTPARVAFNAAAARSKDGIEAVDLTDLPGDGEEAVRVRKERSASATSRPGGLMVSGTGVEKGTAKRVKV